MKNPLCTKRIILASASPRRKELMQLLGLDFEVIPSDVDEEAPGVKDPSDIACRLALLKAEEVALSAPEALVIGADTIVVKEAVLGKPKSRQDAVEMLRCLQGGIHEVITGIVLFDAGLGFQAAAYERTLVTMASLTQREIEEYVDSGEPMDKAGGYGIQGIAARYIPRIDGCYYNVVGMPIHRLWSMLLEYQKKHTVVFPYKY